MKKLNIKGFSPVEGLLLVVIIGIIGGVGFFVYNSQKKTNASLDGAAKSQTDPQKTAKKEETTDTKSTTYSFKELGISMDLLPGWEVKSSPTKEEGVNFYKWTVQKAGADGSIVLNSSGFRGGFEDCGVTAATVNEVSPTHNGDLMFMSWSYASEGKTQNRTGIVRSDEAQFSAKASETALTSPVKSKDLTPGKYFLCISHPLPGFALNLNKEAAPGYARKDSIRAFPSVTSDGDYVELPSTAHSYTDIKTMLTSIK